MHTYIHTNKQVNKKINSQAAHEKKAGSARTRPEIKNHMVRIAISRRKKKKKQVTTYAVPCTIQIPHHSTSLCMVEFI